MQTESFEERAVKHPVIKRAKFWVSVALGIIGLVASIMGINDWLSKNAETAAAPTPSSTVPAPRGTTGGWGPERSTFTITKAAPYAVLNSITDNPNYDDERNFFRVVPGTELKSPAYTDNIRVAPGDVLTFRGLYENSARDSFDASAPSWIQGANAVLSYDTNPTLRSAMYLSIHADNSATIWDGLVIHSESLFKLQYVEGSARIYTNAHGLDQGGYKFNFDELRSSKGVKLGYEQMDGTIKPGYQYAGYIYFEMKVVDAT